MSGRIISFRFLPLSLAGLILLGASFLFAPGPWTRNSASLQLLQALDIQRSLADTEDVLHLKPGLPWQDISAIPTFPCHVLWYSRLAAEFDLAQAKQIIANSQDCPQTALIRRWEGLLAWKMGHREEASAHWLAISSSSLVTWGRSLVLAGKPSLGKALLQTAETQHPEALLSPDVRAQLYQTLGNLARQDGAIPKAIDYYQKAWEASGSSYDDTAYQLAVSHISEGRCQQAIAVLETGLANKGSRSFPIFDSSYLIVLASCHIQMDNAIRATVYLDAAEAVIQAQRADVGPEASDHQQAWLDSVRQDPVFSLQDGSQGSTP